MPIFEYLCDDCGNRFEKLVRRTGDPVECPSCGESHVKTQLSTFAAHASSSSSKGSSELPPCAGGACPHPGMCGLN